MVVSEITNRGLAMHGAFVLKTKNQKCPKKVKQMAKDVAKEGFLRRRAVEAYGHKSWNIAR